MWSERDEIDITYWRLCDEFTIQEAALLVVGENPSAHTYVERQDPDKQPAGYEAASVAILRALSSGAIKGRIVACTDTDMNGNEFPIDGTVAMSSLVDRTSVREWLRSRGVTTGFFFPERSTTADYLDPQHPRYAPKLAAAVRAWTEVKNPGNKTPKQAIGKWLRENAAQFALTDEDGKPNETGIEEVSKVANWQPSGGAPKTPG